jgi:hypothetical protein
MMAALNENNNNNKKKKQAMCVQRNIQARPRTRFREKNNKCYIF